MLCLKNYVISKQVIILFRNIFCNFFEKDLNVVNVFLGTTFFFMFQLLRISEFSTLLTKVWFFVNATFVSACQLKMNNFLFNTHMYTSMCPNFCKSRKKYNIMFFSKVNARSKGDKRVLCQKFRPLFTFRWLWVKGKYLKIYLSDLNK